MDVKVEGFIEEMELAMMDPAAVAEELEEDLSYFEPGFHFWSERLFFAEEELGEDEEEDDNQDDDELDSQVAN